MKGLDYLRCFSRQAHLVFPPIFCTFRGIRPLRIQTRSLPDCTGASAWGRGHPVPVPAGGGADERLAWIYPSTGPAGTHRRASRLCRCSERLSGSPQSPNIYFYCDRVRPTPTEANGDSTVAHEQSPAGPGPSNPASQCPLHPGTAGRGRDRRGWEVRWRGEMPGSRSPGTSGQPLPRIRLLPLGESRPKPLTKAPLSAPRLSCLYNRSQAALPFISLILNCIKKAEIRGKTSIKEGTKASAHVGFSYPALPRFSLPLADRLSS